MTQYIGAVPGSAKQQVITVDQRRSNQNMLINSDFSINQRAYVNGTAISYNTYTRDRWANVNGAAGESFTFDGAGKCTMASTALLGQRVELTDGVTAGTKLVLSWAGSATATIGADSGTSPIIHTVSASEVTAGVILVYFVGAGATVSMPKLEIGETPTIWEPPDPATELARCHRYFQRVEALETAQSLATGHCQNATQGRFTLPYTPKRAAPTLSVSSISDLLVSASGVDAAGTSLGTTNLGIESGRILINVASGLTTGRGALLTASLGAYIDLDAEL